MGKRSRNKGKRGEREACDVMRPLFPDVRRRAMQSRGGSEGADLDGTPGWHVEVGVGARVSPLEKLRQAVEDCGPDYWQGIWANPPTNTVPIALCKRDREGWTVTMRAEDWIALVEQTRRTRPVTIVETCSHEVGEDEANG